MFGGQNTDSVFLYDHTHPWQSRNSVPPVHALMIWLKGNVEYLIYRKKPFADIREDRIPILSFLYDHTHPWQSRNSVPPACVDDLIEMKCRVPDL